MVSTKEAFNCLVGAWGFLNTTLQNTETGESLPTWHSEVPSGIYTFTPDGHYTIIITSNDLTEAEVRPKELSLPSSPSDPDSRWALIGRHTLAVGGRFRVVNVTRSREGLSGYARSEVLTSTLPIIVGQEIVFNYQLYNNCKVLRSSTIFGTVDDLQYFGKL